MWSTLRFFFLIVVLGSSSAPTALAQDARDALDWEVLHRFRVVRPSDHDAFIRDFNSYIETRALGARGRDAVSGKVVPYPSPFQQGLRTFYDAARAQYDRDWFHDADRTVALRLDRPSSRNAMCSWRLDEGPASAPAPCGRGQRTRLEGGIGRRMVHVRIVVDGGTTEKSWPIEIKDIKFAALGDSFASGEGNPHVTFNQGTRGNAANPPRLAEWWDHRCHRSLVSSTAQAAIMLAQARRDTSVTYVSYACSGGTINEGLIGGYDGVETARQAGDRLRFFGGQGDSIPHFRTDPLPVQIRQAAALLCKVAGQSPCLSSVPLDVLAFMTGGNELKFGRKVAECAFGSCRFTDAEMRPLFADLKQQYQALAAQLGAIDARHVALMTYPNMVRNENGAYCGDGPFNFSRNFVPHLATFLAFGVSRSESRNAERVVLDPLNALLAEEARNRGWILVGGYARDRGFCARPTWFHTVNQADGKQGRIGTVNQAGDIFDGLYPSGALHPNVFGHAGIRARLLAEIEGRLPR
jgi:hypothetical protein